tara:strand:+ start:107 stop:322 length:216 start_codon:yes stop_codon:yes gene_type:complete
MKKLLHSLVFSVIFINPIFSQLQVGDISPDFIADVCFNGEDVNPDLVNGDDWSLYDEGAGKVTWINLFTSW